MADREEWKKKEKEQRRRKEDEEEIRPVIWIKYTMGLKHQVWKQKGEEYRVTGGNGWQWISATRKFRTVPQDSVGLRLAAHRLCNRRVRAAKSCSKRGFDGGDDGHMDETPELSASIASQVCNNNLLQKVEEPTVKKEKVEIDEEGTGICKTEVSNSSSEKKPVNCSDKQEDDKKFDVKVKEDEDDADLEMNNKTSIKSGVIKMQKGQSSYDSYITFLRKKYIEDKDTALALEILKKAPEKVDAELINVSEAMQKRTYYVKVTKPYSKLDNLLERRLKQDEFEQKQRCSIETQIALKQKLQQAVETAQKFRMGRDEQNDKEVKMTNGDISDDAAPPASLLYSCYSLLCRSGGSDKYGLCYSPLCRLRQQENTTQNAAKVSSSVSSKVESAVSSESHDGISISSSKEGTPDNLTNEDSMDSQISKESNGSPPEDETNDLEVAGSKIDGEDIGLNKENEAGASKQANKSMEDEYVDIEGDTAKEMISLKTPVGHSSQTSVSGDQNRISESDKKPSSSTSAGNCVKSESSTPASVSDIVKNLVIKTLEKDIHSVGRESLLNTQTLSASVSSMTVDELRARLPPKHSTSEKFKLARFTRIGVKKKVSKNGRLPMCHKFETSSKKKSVLILDRNELRKMARQGAKRESALFNYNCKMSSVCWPYPCPRPLFKTAWRYRTMSLQSLSAAALQLRILWACIRWDDMAAKPPAGGTNTISTETEITTTELLKRREVGIDGLRSEFLVRKIVVPLGVPDKPKEKYTPQRSGLRERKRVEAVRQTEPSVTEVWVTEEVLELWEIKQFGEKLEKQRQALQEKADKAANQQTIVTSQQSTAQIKAQMEQQLKQQRLALAQKRIQENQGVKITTGSNLSTISTLASSSTTTIIINNTNQFGKSGGTFKTLTVSSPSSLLSSGVIKTMQPKPIGTNAGSLLGTQLRPGIRLQIPGSAIQLRPQTVALAPKPGTTIATTSGVSTITRLISPATTTVARVLSPATAPTTKTQTVQLRPQIPGQPVQNLHFTQTPGGQLQVRGLLPGQIIQRMPDGKLQIITLSTSVSAAATTVASSPATTQQQQQQTPRPAVSIRPQTIMVSPSTGGAVAATATPTITQNRLVIPAQLASSLSVDQGTPPSALTVPAIRQVLASSVASTQSKSIFVTRPAGPQIITAQNLASVFNSQSLGTSNNSSLVSASPITSSLSSAVVISAPTVINTAVNPAGISTSLTGVTTVLVSSSQPSTLLPNVTSPPGHQTIISTLKPSALSTVTTSITTTTAGQPVTSLLGGQIISGTSLLQRPTGVASLLNLSSSSGSIPVVSGSSVSSQIPKLLTSPAAGSQIITRPLGSTQPQLVLRPGTSMFTGAGQAKIITTQQLRGLATSPIQLKPAPTSLSPIKAVLSPQSSSVVLPTASTPTLTAVRSLTPQLTIQTSAGPQQIIATSLLPQGLTLTSSPEAGSATVSVTSPTTGTSPSRTGTPKYAITPQVVEQVVRQALLQNQTPEIQQKLLAMQKQIQQQQQTQPVTTMAVLAAVPSGSSGTARRSFPSSISMVGKPASNLVNDLSKLKTKGLTQEQKEEQSRISICGQVMKNILDKIEREEKQEQRNKKKQESAEEKHKRLTAVNQQKALYKHKEALKKEILRKRSLMEKNLQQEIYNEMAENLKQAKTVISVTSPQPGTVATPVPAPSSLPPVIQVAHIRPKKVMTDVIKTHPGPADAKSLARKRKQKIISTGVKGLNPKEKLYCVCKTPYDDSKFYIGCDLCSNWFHGACVNISEDRARFIDSYVCEDCRKQQENTSEELYCLCQTPYDENQFYIGCDRCQDWFHGYCVGISKQEADSIEVYVCPNCQKEEVADPIAQKPLTASEYHHLQKLLKDLQVHKMAWPFLQPVDPNDVPDYYDIVPEPMDLTIVEAKLNTRAYHKLNDFVKDITKIFDNCRLYNPVDTAYYQCAEVVETYFAQRIKSLRSANKL